MPTFATSIETPTPPLLRRSTGSLPWVWPARAPIKSLRVPPSKIGGLGGGLPPASEQQATNERSAPSKPARHSCSSLSLLFCWPWGGITRAVDPPPRVHIPRQAFSSTIWRRRLVCGPLIGRVPGGESRPARYKGGDSSRPLAPGHDAAGFSEGRRRQGRHAVGAGAGRAAHAGNDSVRPD